MSNRIASQTPIHQRYGGVVPEIASRAHVEAILPLVRQALAEAGLQLSDLDAIAVTRGPGLIGCLLVGVETAKALAASSGRPLIAVHHIAGHHDSVHLGTERDAWGAALDPDAPRPPHIGLVLSGGHSSIALVRGPLNIEPLGETLDDAVGEAYDKVAKLLGLGYPGGPIIDRLALEGDPAAFDFPRPMAGRAGFDFSFSGLKTSVARTVAQLGGGEAIRADPTLLANLCASFQQAAIDVVLDRALAALRANGLFRLAITGGVACNRGLRAALASRFTKTHVALPDPILCTDNAAMIAGLAHHLLAAGRRASLELNARADLRLADSDGGALWQLP